MFPATIFDFNGVLVDDELVHRDAFREVLAPLGVSFSDQEYAEKYIGLDDVRAITTMMVAAGRTPTGELVADLVRAKRPLYMRRTEATLVVFEGAEALVRRQAARGPIAIVSGALRDEIWFALRRMGIDGLMSFVLSAEDTARGKPDPLGYQLAIAALAASIGAQEAARALVIEDSLAGVEAARRAGLPCLAVAHSYPEAQLRAAGADAVARRVGDVDDELLLGIYRRRFSGEGG